MNGDSYKDIIFYWFPELISTTILLALPSIIDSYIIANLGSVTTFGALGMVTNILLALTKLAEAIPVASMALIGRCNGSGEYAEGGQYFYNTLWITFALGFLQFILILIGAYWIFEWMDVPPKMILTGLNFLRLKSLGVMLIFFAMGLLAFMRAVKNTFIPMILYIIGIAVFIFFDYILVLGKLGFVSHGLSGSAHATIIQYSLIILLASIYIFFNREYKKYFPDFKNIFNLKKIRQITYLSIPISIDKMTLALAYLWLSKLIVPMGKYTIVSFNVIKGLSLFIFLPVIASAQVTTFLVSNKLGAKDIKGARTNIYKMVIITILTIIPLILILSLKPQFFVNLFDPKNKFTDFTVIVFPFISIFMLLDVFQVIFAGALRGAGDVKFVMWTRLWVCLLIFVPFSKLLSYLPIQNILIKFTLLYSFFPISTGIIAILYLKRLKGNFGKALKLDKIK